MLTFNTLHKHAIGKLEELKQHGCSFIFTNGCFDIITAGHVSLLRELHEKYIGDNSKRKLIVGVNSDSSVQRLKGPARPLHTLQHRIEVLEAIRYVGVAVPFCEDTPLELITLVRPDILAKGGDYEGQDIVGGSVVRAAGGIVVYGRTIKDLSTTRCLEATEGKLQLVQQVSDLLNLSLVPAIAEGNCSHCGLTCAQSDCGTVIEAILRERKNCVELYPETQKLLQSKFPAGHKIWDLWSEK